MPSSKYARSYEKAEETVEVLFFVSVLVPFPFDKLNCRSRRCFKHLYALC